MRPAMQLSDLPFMRRIWWNLRTGSWTDDPRAMLTMRMWAVAAVPVLVLVFWDSVQVGLTNGEGKVLGRDFVDFWTGARFVLAGNGVGAYDLEAFRAAIRDLAGAPIQPYLYSYPPSLMLLTLPLAVLPFVVALAVWTIGGGIALFAQLRPLLGGRHALIALLAAPATFVNAMTGQTGALSAMFLGGGLLLLDAYPVMAGILLGLLSYKPQLGMLLPIALAFGGHWRAFFVAVASVIVLAVSSAAVVGVDAWFVFPDRLQLMQKLVMEHGQDLWHRTPTAYVSARLVGIDPAFAWVVHAPVALAALVAVVVVWRRPNVLSSVKAATLVLATLLVTPYASDYDMVVLVVVMAWRFKEGGWRPWEATALMLAMMLPFFHAIAAKGLGLPIGPFVLLLALWTVARDVEGVDVRASPHLGQRGLKG